jgi:hypothetical protein
MTVHNPHSLFLLTGKRASQYGTFDVTSRPCWLDAHALVAPARRVPPLHLATKHASLIVALLLSPICVSLSSQQRVYLRAKESWVKGTVEVEALTASLIEKEQTRRMHDRHRGGPRRF